MTRHERTMVARLALVSVLMSAGSVSAGSWTIRCTLEDEKIEMNFDHYSEEAADDYGNVPDYAILTVGDDPSQELRQPTKQVAGLLIYPFDKHTVVYSGSAEANTHKHITVYDKAGGFVASGACTH